MQQSDQLSGVICPVTTPLDEHWRVDEDAYRRQIRRLLNAGVHGIFFGGSAGEGPLLLEKEWIRAAQIAFEETRERNAHLLGGVQDTSTPRVLERIGRLKEIGYRNYVSTPTYYIAARSG